MRVRVFVCLVLSVSLLCPRGVAWGWQGHRIVGAIAERLLTPRAAAEVATLLGGASLADVSTWADEVRGEPGFEWTKRLHYVNAPRGARAIELERDCDDRACVVAAIEDFAAIAGDATLATAARRDALRYLVHFVGDVHQPLHASYADDLGGNRVDVSFLGEPDWNLHAVWDSAILGELTGGDWATFAERLLVDLDPERARRWATERAPLAWANESYALVAEVDGPVVVADGTALDAAYQRRAAPIVERRLAAAGVRLAATLNALFDPGASAVSAATLVASAGARAAAEDEGAPRNVIVMIADGAGYNTWAAASMYQGRWDADAGRSAGQLFDGEDWVHVGKACWTLREDAGDVDEQDNDVDPYRMYDPAKAWDEDPASAVFDRYSYPDRFESYRWHKDVHPDSAATMTQMMTGTKTYNGAINVDGELAPLRSFADLAHATGRRVGVLSSVLWAHATPAAAAGASSPSRGDYEAIASEILNAPVVDVLMGAGHPAYTDDGTRARVRDPRYVGGASEWTALETGRHPGGWTFVDALEDFERLASHGTLADGRVPERLLGIARVRATLQQGRATAPGEAAPGDAPRVPGVPDLPLMARGALELLGDDERGFFLMIEGGAVDWAMHANQTNRMIEEMVEFVETVEAVDTWIRAHGGYDETLLVLTADHDHLFFGPRAGEVAHDGLVDRGPGELPDASWHWNNHSNHLVPLYARGAGASMFVGAADDVDPVRGPYVDDTELFTVMALAWGLDHRPARRPAQAPARREDPAR